jgi:hypothetical protein
MNESAVTAGTSGWEIASTIATCAAVMIALFLAVIPPVWRARQRRRRLPRLNLECGVGDPFVRGAKSDAIWQYLRARITNEGGGPASGIRAVAVQARQVDGSAAGDLVIDPFELHWVSLPPPPRLVKVGGSLVAADGVRTSRMDLTARDWDLVDVCRHSGGRLELVPHDDRDRGFDYICPDRTATYEVTIRVTADEVDPAEFRLRFRFVLPTGGGGLGNYESVSVERVEG